MSRPEADRWRVSAALIGLVALQGLAGCAAPTRGRTTVTINNNGFSMTGGNRATEAVQKSFQADKVTNLKVSGATGNIEITPAPAGVNEIHIQATKIVTGDGAVEHLKNFLPKIQATAALEGDTLTVQADCPPDVFKDGVSGSVDYVISVPSRLAYDLRTGSGDILARGIKGGGALHSDFGKIEAHDVSGVVEASSSSGEITIDGAQSADSVTAHTDFGNVDLKNVGGVIDARTNSGTITVSQAQQAKSLTLHSDFGAIEINDSSGPVDASSKSGQVSLANARVRDSLLLHSDFGNVEATDIHALGAALKVELTTSSGSVNFRGDASELTLRSDFGAVEGEIASTLTLQSATLHTGSGSVDLTLPRALSAKIDAKTSSGSIDLGDSANSAGGSDASGRSLTLGAGSAPINLTSDFGNITLHLK